MITRELLGRVLVDATEELAQEQHRDMVYAAPLAVRVMSRLKAALGDEGTTQLAVQLGTTEKRMKLTGAVFAPALYPQASVEEAREFKFRHLLEAFPDAVQVFKGPSGDMVRLLKGSTGDPAELNRKYRTLLLATLGELLRERGLTDVPSNQLAIWMKKRNPAFNVVHLGYSSLSEWLQNVPEVKTLNTDGVLRVGLVENIGPNEAAPADQQDMSLPAYLLVDSSDLHAALHEILGSKPAQSQLPEWGKVIQYCRDRWPHFDWRCRYLMALSPPEHQPLQGFLTYLQAVGFKALKLNLPDSAGGHEETRQARAQTTQRGIERAVQLIRDEGCFGLLLIASHSAALADALSPSISEKGEPPEYGFIGFAEKMPQRVTDLKRRGLLVIDLERDCKAFKRPLNRSLGLNPEDINAEEIL